MTKLAVAFRYVANTPKSLADRHIPHRMLSHHVGTSVASEKKANFSKPVLTDVTFESSNNKFMRIFASTCTNLLRHENHVCTQTRAYKAKLL